ncbi:hypothetical protein PsB1_1546 [Candidatus Phycosocius spiralis]|uniref:Uncharacterized protein n=1 Tax=Candidatus Phycosocius spiralis TaxID=2815099 RepID=A0ABQ4PWL6_9PROT|nr:hypothetical protein PsB1_1546 [Candidatus Phycosocius spiralis]
MYGLARSLETDRLGRPRLIEVEWAYCGENGDADVCELQESDKAWAAVRKAYAANRSLNTSSHEIWHVSYK